MAKIEELIAQLPDERLRKAIAAEVRELKKSNEFGLVFESICQRPFACRYCP